MTERLYYNDSFLREFDAQVLACEPDGARWRVRLDRTAFYPTSGGQPFDTGRLGDVAVVEVLDAENDEITHFTDQPVVAGAIHAAIDWPRRFDHMQQHTAQHMLSAAFIELFKFQTVSFHMGREISTIDLAAPSITPRQLEEAERRVNEIIFADRQPCGGTHLARTGQAGLLLTRKCERQKQGWRVEFVAGWRALAAARGDFAALRQAAEHLGCGMAELPENVRKIQEERRASQRDAKKVTERLAELEATDLLSRHTETSNDGKCRIIVSISDDVSSSYLAMLAAKIVATPNMRAILASRAANAIVLAQSAGLDGDMGALLRELLGPVGGKGGGSKVFAQGTVPQLSVLDGMVNAARARL